MKLEQRNMKRRKTELTYTRYVYQKKGRLTKKAFINVIHHMVENLMKGDIHSPTGTKLRVVAVMLTLHTKVRAIRSFRMDEKSR